jgi:hypothetical protein
MSLPPHVRAAVRRILDAEARRLLAEEVDVDALEPAAGVNVYTLDGGPDQRAASLEAQPVPVAGASDDLPPRLAA